MGLELPFSLRMQERLDIGEAHLWYCEPDRVAAPQLVAAGDRLLSEEERVENSRISMPWVRQLHFAARVLSRTMLSHYSDVPPECWSFARNEYGRPEIAYPPGNSHFSFNLSHTRGCVACLIARDRQVGVDVEGAGATRNQVADIAGHFFSATELSALRSLPDSLQRASFLKYWTLKESYIKARGVGISLGLSRFSFHLDEPSIRISFDPDFDDDPGLWQFDLFQPWPTHLIAAGIGRSPGECVRIHLRDATGLLC